jgi:hypothetical protein
MLFVILILLSASLVSAQAAQGKDEMLRLAEQLQVAVGANDWKKAAELSAALRAATTNARNESFARGTSEQVDTILRWLPENTETVLVAQESFAIEVPHPHMEQHDALAQARGFSLNRKSVV